MEKFITIEKYQEGILDICDFLIVDLKKFMIEEDRFKYRVVSFFDKLREVYSDVHKEINEEDIDIYGRVLYNIKRSLESEFKKLRDKKMSSADCIICILMKLISISESYDEKTPDFKFKSSRDQIKEIISILFNNIRHFAKHDKLKKIEYHLTNSINTLRWGTLRVDKFDITNPKIEKIQTITEETEVYNITSNTEISL